MNAESTFGFSKKKREKNHLFPFWLYGKVPLIIFVISVIFLIISITINYIPISLTLLGLIFTPILTLLFVILNDIHNTKNKNEFIFDILVDEIGHNLQTLYENDGNLEEEKNITEEKSYIPNVLYPLKTEIWNYSISNMSINPFYGFMELYNGFLYESMRYNKLIKFRNSMTPHNIAPRSFETFLDIRDKFNKNVDFFGKAASDMLTSILKENGNLSIINTQNFNDEDEIRKHLEKDGFSEEEIDAELEENREDLSKKEHYLILYYY